MRSLSNGLLVTITGGSSAQDLAVNATQCALALRSIHPNAEAVLATGRMDAKLDASAVVSRAIALLDKGQGLGLLRVDETTASLISSRFVLRDQDGVSIVVSRADAGAPVRTLIGKPMPCVGSRQGDRSPRSDLRRMRGRIRRARRAGDGASWNGEITPAFRAHRTHRFIQARRDEARRVGRRRRLARGSFGRSRSGLGRRGRATRRHERSPIRRDRSAYRDARGYKDKTTRLVEFLSELTSTQGRAAPSDLLSSARNEPRIMNEWMQRSFEEWLSLLANRRPLLVIVEDMHWADEPSLTYLAGALRRVADAPLMLLGLARPEVSEMLPEAFAKLSIQEVRLGGLTRRSAERLVRFALPSLHDGEVSDIVDRADGNAFFLEELIRWSANLSANTSRERLTDPLQRQS